MYIKQGVFMFINNSITYYQNKINDEIVNNECS